LRSLETKSTADELIDGPVSALCGPCFCKGEESFLGRLEEGASACPARVSEWRWFGLTIATMGSEVVLESDGRVVVERLGFSSLVRRFESFCEGSAIAAAADTLAVGCC
jgi:hypothetical protein